MQIAVWFLASWRCAAPSVWKLEGINALASPPVLGPMKCKLYRVFAEHQQLHECTYGAVGVLRYTLPIELLVYCDTLPTELYSYFIISFVNFENPG